MQNPKRMIYLRNGASKTLYGLETGNRYRFGGSDKHTWVDERDVPGFLSTIQKNKSTLFKLDSDQRADFIDVKVAAPMVDPLEDFVVEHAEGNVVRRELPFEDEVVELAELQEVFDFTRINGIGKSTSSYIQSMGILTPEALHEAGIGFLMTIPRMYEDKATKILKQLEELI
jgi:hypothetical protein